jgi:hypothetical protein
VGVGDGHPLCFRFLQGVPQFWTDPISTAESEWFWRVAQKRKKRNTNCLVVAGETIDNRSAVRPHKIQFFISSRRVAFRRLDRKSRDGFSVPPASLWQHWVRK